MEFDKLSLGSPMACANQEEDLANAENLLQETDGNQGEPHAPLENHDTFYIPQDEEYVCQYVTDDAYKNKGTLVQFLNQNCSDAATIIGGVRIPISEAPLLPAYLCRHRQLLTRYAVWHLNRHLVETQSAAGATETLCLDDYGLSFMLASVSDAGKNLHPMRRMEGPLLYCLYPHLNTPVTLYTNPDGTLERVNVVNAYIHLYDVHRRRRSILLRATQAEETNSFKDTNAPAPAPTLAPAAVKRKSTGPSPLQTTCPIVDASGKQIGSVQMQRTKRTVATAISAKDKRNIYVPSPSAWKPPLPSLVLQPPPPPPSTSPSVVAPLPLHPTDDRVVVWDMFPKLPDFPPA
jgi:hypothetical protein